jgi:hypothetical protein
MGKLGHCLGFPLEAGHKFFVAGKLFPGELYGYHPAEELVPGLKHQGHSSAADAF